MIIPNRSLRRVSRDRALPALFQKGAHSTWPVCRHPGWSLSFFSVSTATTALVIGRITARERAADF